MTGRCILIAKATREIGLQNIQLFIIIRAFQNEATSLMLRLEAMSDMMPIIPSLDSSLHHHRPRAITNTANRKFQHGEK